MSLPGRRSTLLVTWMVMDWPTGQAYVGQGWYAEMAHLGLRLEGSVMLRSGRSPRHDSDEAGA